MRTELRLMLFTSGLLLGLACASGGDWMVSSARHPVVPAPAPGTEHAVLTEYRGSGTEWTRLTVRRASHPSWLAIEVDAALPQARPIWTSAERVELEVGEVTVAVYTRGG